MSTLNEIDMLSVDHEASFWVSVELEGFVKDSCTYPACLSGLDVTVIIDIWYAANFRDETIAHWFLGL